MQSSADDLAQVRAENEKLRAELARLREQNVSPDSSARGQSSPAGRGRWRSAVSAVLIVIAAVLAPVSLVAAYAERQVNDTDTFVATFGPLLDDPEIQEVIVSATVQAIDDAVDIDGLTASAVDGLAGLGLPDRAARALALLEGPAAEGIRSLVRQSVSTIVDSDALATVWNEALRASSLQLRATLSGDERAVFTVDRDGTVGLHVGPVVRQVKQLLDDRGFGFAALIPEVNTTIPLTQVDQLAQAQTGYRLLTLSATVLPWLTLILFAAGVLIARRRARTLLTAAVVLGLVMLLVMVALAVVRPLVISTLSSSLSAGAALAIYNTSVSPMLSMAVALAVLAGAVAVVGYIAGPFAGGLALRRFASAGLTKLRETASRYGVNTGSFGVFVYRFRVTVRIAVAVVAAVVILFVRPLTVGLIVGTLVLALLVIVIAELVARPEGESAAEDELASQPQTDRETVQSSP